MKFIGTVIWKFMSVAFVVFGIWVICKMLKVDFPTWFSVILSAIGIGIPGLNNLRKKWKEYQEQIKKI